MSNNDVIERTAPELLKPYRSDTANVCEAAPPQGPDRICLLDAVAGASGIAIAEAFKVRRERISDRDRFLADHPALAIDLAQVLGALGGDRVVDHRIALGFESLGI